jgi:hypothetical protein
MEVGRRFPDMREPTYGNSGNQQPESIVSPGRHLVLTDDGRGVYIHGRDPQRPDTTTWTFRCDAGIEFLAVEDLVEMEANHLDIELGLPISYPIWKADADEYANSPAEYKARRLKNVSQVDSQDTGTCSKCGKILPKKDVLWCLCD